MYLEHSRSVFAAPPSVLSASAWYSLFRATVGEFVPVLIPDRRIFARKFARFGLEIRGNEPKTGKRVVTI